MFEPARLDNSPFGGPVVDSRYCYPREPFGESSCRGVGWVRDAYPPSTNSGTTVRGSTWASFGNSGDGSTHLGLELSILGHTTGVISISVGIVQGQVDSVLERVLSRQQEQTTGSRHLVACRSRLTDGRRTLDVSRDRSSGTILGIGDVLGVCFCECRRGVPCFECRRGLTDFAFRNQSIPPLLTVLARVDMASEDRSNWSLRRMR